MWTFNQSTGAITLDGALVTMGYSGHGPGKNNPAMQNVKNVGPLPVGLYTIDGLISHDPQCGEYVLLLMPDATNEMFGRDGFRWHGDSIIHPGWASDGCIASCLDARREAWQGSNHRLEVVSGKKGSLTEAGGQNGSLTEASGLVERPS